MAGRPVAARGGGGLLYGLIAFVIVAVAGIGGFVWQLTSNEALRTANENDQRKLKQYGTPPQYYLNEASARGTDAFSVMRKDFEDVAFLVTGKRDAVRPAIVETSNRLLQQIAATTPAGTVEPSDTLLTALRRLHSAYMQLRSEHDAATTDLAEARLQSERALEGLNTVRQDFATEMDAQKQDMTRLEQERSDQLSKKDEQLAQQQAEAQATGEALSKARVDQQRSDRDHEIAMQRLRSDLESLQEQVRVQKSGFNPYDILKKADGRILRAIPGSDVVYINLGRNDHIRPGMSFEVFSPTAGDREESFRGKASVEVTTVLDATAECRVTRSTPGRPIVEGDAIVNIAYERSRRPKFVVRGEFDLDYDGEKDWNGIERVTAIIEAWGGQVVDKIDESTDFLVLGMGPSVPPLPGNRPVTDVIRSLTDARLKDLNEYRHEIQVAQTFYIPIITQTQFLYLTGYSGPASLLVD